MFNDDGERNRYRDQALWIQMMLISMYGARGWTVIGSEVESANQDHYLLSTEVWIPNERTVTSTSYFYSGTTSEDFIFYNN